MNCLRRLHLRRKGEEGTHRIMTQWGIICSILHSHTSVAPRSSHDESLQWQQGPQWNGESVQCRPRGRGQAGLSLVPAWQLEQNEGSKALGTGEHRRISDEP